MNLKTQGGDRIWITLLTKLWFYIRFSRLNESLNHI